MSVPRQVEWVEGSRRRSTVLQFGRRRGRHIKKDAFLSHCIGIGSRKRALRSPVQKVRRLTYFKSLFAAPSPVNLRVLRSDLTPVNVPGAVRTPC
ncbi:hypothetical protein BDW66DRAFT_42681 [Aspergillus desertorum]